ncbi:alpha-L-arabinofuranosidase B [Exidia glandulosa HHB12029]|uniref:non-reducing end alpha-L-arabinofuranosidase n=1 Tax=Exidia glandulosa HHB12029 TaxID=1314781 RepID=A0A165FMA1_EXIGL|nr:alpha-L-arabinofuranosidase B [Exidia glandulosa HHB12029]
MVFKYLTVVVAALSMAVHAAYIQKTPPLTTPWTSQVSLTNPLPEYPRPQLVRSDWQSLNGQWQFAASSQITSPPTGQTLGETILVPFPLESAISGIMRHETNSFYRRTFTIPAAWSGRRVQLNFGAVTWRATVWINGQNVGTHSGGYEAFSFDITSQLNGGTNEIIVGVYSPVDAAGIPLGKQRLNGTSIFYTAASGIWQTVWLEPTQAARITQLDTTPDIHAGVLSLAVKTSGASGQTVTAIVSTGGTTVGNATAPVGTTTVLRIPVPNARLWSPDDPFLYDLRVTLTSGDVVTGYFGMRSVGTAIVNGWLRPVLNGRFIFQMGTLDQGYWPDGIYTAPTDAALSFDLERQKALGFNTVRKHIKVEPARWFYHADRLGLLVFQDMPAMRTDGTPSASDRTNFEDELRRMIDQLRGITSIVQWIPFNEGWGEYDEARIADLTKSFDSTRPINGNSGSNCCGRDPGNGDIVDDHIYVGPGSTHTPTATRFAQLGEFGGLGLRVAGHEWQPGAGFSYEIVADAAALNKRYVEVSSTLQGLIWGRGLSGSIYTEPTDVENEVNGYYTYDRQVFKGNFDQFKAIHQAVIGSVAWLRAGESISLGVTTSGFTDRYVRHVDGLGVTSPVSDALSRKDTTWRVRAGLASSSCWSFESRNYPGSYLRHFNNRIQRDASDGSALFNADATFCLRTGGTKSGVSFESYNQAGKFLRHYNGNVYVASNGGSNAWDTTTSWAADTTWQVASPSWRSGADITTDARVSLQVTTAGLTDRYIRHQNALAITSVANASSDATTRSDATFIARAGLADPSCYSFEASNFAGQFLRHANFRLQIAPNDNSEVFSRDATFCAQPGLNDASAVTLRSYNIAGHAIRHINAEVWLAISGGPKTQDAAASYAADVTWRVAAPLA